MLSLGYLKNFLKCGLIVHIPKSEDRSHIGNWHPIMLLGSVVYKVLTKLSSIRIQVLLLDIIRPNQIGFVVGKSILDTMFLAQKAMEWTMERKQRLVLLMLDFENVFDCIN
jgi:hypothetical protein